ncbi:pentapeptide repeat-containing protein [Cyanobium sp. NIES-981]|uniref:pentapeptide repeat-containing protein n=1 Tax=Cyanobium sp. NIES-981 TaxID=1851505 RepID=UPI0012FBC027|nr:pentapeptide repeat-containing protein [Cyanobium sp. NIES-981]
MARRTTAPSRPGGQAPFWLISLLTLALALPLGWLVPSPALAAVDVAKQVLIGADYHGQDLRGGTFNLTNLRDADLSGSDLQGASLFGAKLQDADLSNTNLREATLDSAVFNGTDLTNAVLEDAFAFNTKFTDVIIDGADFTNVPLRGDALKALCAVAGGTNPVTGRRTRDTLGCS